MAGRKLKNQPRCNAWSRSARRHCRAKALPGKTKCRHHGGLSTGPKTPEGKVRAKEARAAGSRAAWARWRAEVGLPQTWRSMANKVSKNKRKRLGLTAASYIERHGPWNPAQAEEALADGEPCTKTPAETLHVKP